MSDIRVYPSHIEVFPYSKGDNFPLEKSLSVWEEGYHRYKPIAYMIHDHTLYLPRGVNITLLETQFFCNATYMNEPDKYDKMSKKYEALYQPRDRIQGESIDFLTSQNKFYGGNYCSQFGLNLDTGDGKTYTMLNAIVQMGNKAIVITHKNRIKLQWIRSAEDMMGIPSEKILDITSSDIVERLMNIEPDFDIYFVNHQTLAALARKYDWTKVREFFKKIRVGVKVVDEAHKFFENSVKIDMFSNVNRSYYLTATFGRSDDREEKIFKMVYSNIMRFGEETLDYDEKRKHIVMIAVKYKSNPDYATECSMFTRNHGFSSYKFIDYALNEENHSMEKILKRILDKCENIRGRTLITVPKIEATEEVADIVRKYTTQSVYTVHSKNSPKDNEYATDYGEIIVSTAKSTGEGDDIAGLRKLINFEPLGSKLAADQLRGRLREYDHELDTYLFYPVDISVKKVYEFYRRILPVMRKKCKEIIEIEINDI